MSYKVEFSFPPSPGGKLPFGFWSETGEWIGSCDMLRASQDGIELAGWTVADEVAMVVDGKSHLGRLGAPRQDAVDAGYSAARVFQAWVPKGISYGFISLTIGVTPHLFLLNLDPQ